MKLLEDARHIFFKVLEEDGFFRKQEKEIDVREAIGRVTSRAVFARRNSPPFRSSAMDGVAVRADGIRAARKDAPRRLERRLEFVYVDTGQRVPEDFDSVVKIEDVAVIDEDTVEITEPVSTGKHVREAGEDFKAGELVLPQDFRITPVGIAASVNTGNLRVYVKRKLKCAYLPVGSELVPADSELSADQVPESNSQIVKGFLTQWGGEVTVYPIVRNEISVIKKTLGQISREFDLIIVGAGTSKGREDMTSIVISELGQVLVHGVAYHPGHPILLGLINDRPAIGLPGYAVATWIGIMQFIRPVFEKYLKNPLSDDKTVLGVLTRDIKSVLNAREFVRVKLIQAESGYLVDPLPGGASRLSSLLQADGIVEVDENTAMLHHGEKVTVRLLRQLP